jgi:hypothetical protein
MSTTILFLNGINQLILLMEKKLKTLRRTVLNSERPIFIETFELEQFRLVRKEEEDDDDDGVDDELLFL